MHGTGLFSSISSHVNINVKKCGKGLVSYNSRHIVFNVPFYSIDPKCLPIIRSNSINNELCSIYNLQVPVESPIQSAHEAFAAAGRGNDTTVFKLCSHWRQRGREEGREGGRVYIVLMQLIVLLIEACVASLISCETCELNSQCCRHGSYIAVPIYHVLPYSCTCTKRVIGTAVTARILTHIYYLEKT